jgi:hypothetical protein
MLVHRYVDAGDTRHLFLPHADNNSAREKARYYIRKTLKDQFISHVHAALTSSLAAACAGDPMNK